MTSSEIVKAPHAVVPLADLGRRLPEQGRIRLGIKKVSKAGKEYPSNIPAFRFTSHDKAALEALAAEHGGTVRPWNTNVRAGEYELISQATKLRIALPPEPLSQHYELWSGGGCQRRCDGVTVAGGAVRQTPDGAEPVDVPCVCQAQGKLECKATTRLTVILRDVPFGGGWLLTTGGWIAAKELPGMVELIQQLQGRGLTTALLMLKECSDVKNGQTRKWMVPALAIPNTIDELASGQAQLGALASGEQVQRLAIDAPLTPTPAAVEADARTVELPQDADDIADAELVDEGGLADSGTEAPLAGEEDGPGTDRGSPAAGAAGPSDSPRKMLNKLHALVKKLHDSTGVEVDVLRHGLAKRISGQESSGALDPDQLATALDILDDIEKGRRKFMGVDALGVFRVGERHES